MIGSYRKIIEEKCQEAHQNMTTEQFAQCQKLIHSAAFSSALAGALPLPFADAIPISIAQVGMVIGLGNVFNEKISESAAKGMISAALATVVGRGLVKLIPGIGLFISAAVASGLTESIGWIIALELAEKYKRRQNN